MFSARLDEAIAAGPSPSAVLPSTPYSELHDASFHSAGHPASPEPSSSESSDILSALSPTAEVVEQKNSNPPVTQPLTTEERAHQLELSAAYGVERAKLEIELQAYQKDPPTSEYGRKRVEGLSRGIQELDQAAVKRMQDLKGRIETDPELAVKLQLEFTREVRDLRGQQALNTLRVDGFKDLISSAHDQLADAKNNLENLGWLERVMGGAKPFEGIINHQQNRSLPALEESLKAFQAMEQATNALVEQFIEKQTNSVLAKASGQEQMASEHQVNAAALSQKVLAFDAEQQKLIDRTIGINNIGWKESQANFDSYMSTLKTTAETCTTIRDACVVVGAGVATGGLGLIAGVGCGVGIALTTRAGGNALAVLMSDNLTFDEVFKDFKAEMTGDMALVVSGVLGAGVGGAVTKSLLGKSTSLLRAAVAASAGGSTAGTVGEGVLIAKDYLQALEEFEKIHEGSSLSDEERGQMLKDFLSNKGLNSEDLIKRLEVAALAGGAGGVLGIAGSRAGQAVTSATRKVGIELAEGAADVVAGESIAAVINGEELSMKAIFHGMIAASLGSVAARAESRGVDVQRSAYQHPPAVQVQISSSVPLEIGRSPMAHLQVDNEHGGVSGRHASLWTSSDGKVYVKDGGLDGRPSTNGTFIIFPDGRRVQVGQRPTEIPDGAIIALGSDFHINPLSAFPRKPVMDAELPKAADRGYKPRQDAPDGEDGRTMLAGELRIHEGYERGINGARDRYLGRDVIGHGTSIDGGIYIGASKREAIVVDFKKDHVLEAKYQEFLSRMDKLRSRDSRTYRESILQELHDFVDKSLGGQHTGIVRDTETLIRDAGLNEDKKVYLGFFITGDAGVCRHRALMAGAFLERMIKEGKIDGSVEVRRNTREEGGHAWALYTNSKGEQIVIDPMQGFIGRPDDARAFWDYREAGDPVAHSPDSTQAIAIDRIKEKSALHKSALILNEYQSPVRVHTTESGHTFLDWGNINGLAGKPDLLAKARGQIDRALAAMSQSNPPGVLPANFGHNTEQRDGVTFIRLNNGRGNTRVVLTIDKNQVPHVVGCYTHGDGLGNDYNMFEKIMENALADPGFRAVCVKQDRVTR